MLSDKLTERLNEIIDAAHQLVPASVESAELAQALMNYRESFASAVGEYDEEIEDNLAKALGVEK